MKIVCIALALFAAVQLGATQSQTYTSTLFQSYNSTSQQTGYLQCNENKPVADISPTNETSDGTPLVQLSEVAAGRVTVDAVWFGGAVGPASNFQVVGNCSALQLTSNGGHGTTVYTGPVPLAPNGCTVTWYQQTNYLTVYVAITNTGFGWSVSLPTVTSVRAQTACNGGYQYCPLATGVPCSTVLNLPATLLPDGSFPPALAPAASTTSSATSSAKAPLPAAPPTTTSSAKASPPPAKAQAVLG